MDRIVITSPDAVVAVLPYLVGFQPDDSLVIAWTREDELVLTECLAIPTVDADENAWLAGILRPALRWHPDAATIVVSDGRDWDDDDDDDPDDWDDDDEYREAATTFAPALPHARIVDAVRAAVERRGIEVFDAIYTRRGRWWSYLCHDQCCPPQGRVIDPQVDLVLRARFAFAGITPLASRRDVVAQYAADPDAQRRVAPLLAAAVADRDSATDDDPDHARASWRAAQLAGPCADILRPSVTDIDDDVVAELLCALGDHDVRDDFVRTLASERPLADVVSALALAARAAPTGHVAPVATCAAVAAWLHGDGVRARIALDRALADDPVYPLAGLVHAALTHGLRPNDWRESLTTTLAA